MRAKAAKFFKILPLAVASLSFLVVGYVLVTSNVVMTAKIGEGKVEAIHPHDDTISSGTVQSASIVAEQTQSLTTSAPSLSTASPTGSPSRTTRIDHKTETATTAAPTKTTALPMGSTSPMTTTTNATNGTRPKEVLFLIFCGGPSGNADMDAILDTWGKRVKHALIMTNTPKDLPLDRIMKSHATAWQIYNTTSMAEGSWRNGPIFWKDAIDTVHTTLQMFPNLKWVVRSDSDTWWNVPLLYRELLHPRGRLSGNKPLVMGQFFPLVDGRWQRNNTRVITTFDQSNGRNAYLTGGSGAVFTRAAVSTLYSCFQRPDYIGAHFFGAGREDIWLSGLVHFCNVTLIRHPRMEHFPQRMGKSTAPKMLSIHRAVGDGRKGYPHPRIYEEQLVEGEKLD
jgi:hypothetical protein